MADVNSGFLHLKSPLRHPATDLTVADVGQRGLRWGMVGWRDLGFRSTLFFFSAHVFSSTVQQSVLVPAEPKITAQFCFVNYYHSYLNLSFLLFLLPSLSHYGVLSCPIAHLFCRLMQHIRHPSVFHHLDWSCLALCLGFCWSTVHAFMFV